MQKLIRRLNSEVSHFKHSNLKHSQTVVHEHLPTQRGKSLNLCLLPQVQCCALQILCLRSSISILLLSSPCIESLQRFAVLINPDYDLFISMRKTICLQRKVCTIVASHRECTDTFLIDIEEEKRLLMTSKSEPLN